MNTLLLLLLLGIVQGDIPWLEMEALEECEKGIVARPNSSYLWIKYMSTVLQISDISKARNVAERALKTINFREEQEKMNVWVAYLNMENLFGTPDSLEKIFAKSIIYCDAKSMYMQLAKIYIASKKQDEFSALIKTILKKYGTSCKVWQLYGEYLYEKDLGNGRKLLAQALESLPKKKHPKISMKFAQLEYRLGSRERARTIFESILAENPKRIDIWSIYLTMEENYHHHSEKNRSKGDKDNSNKAYVRRLYERVLSTKLSSKKAKYFFKKYLEFEKKFGNQNTIEHVKDLARKFVEKLH